MLEESKYCSDMIKKHFTKELAMTQKDNQDFENYTNCCICYNVNVDSNDNIRGHYHMTGIYRESVHIMEI